MNRIIVFISLFLLSTPIIAAERWVAKCINGEKIHYVQKYKSVGHLFMTVETPFNNTEVVPVATLRQSKITDVSICGVVQGNGGTLARPISQICMNRKLQIIYVKFDDPVENTGLIEGEFCKADVKVYADNW